MARRRRKNTKMSKAQLEKAYPLVLGMLAALIVKQAM